MLVYGANRVVLGLLKINCCCCNENGIYQYVGIWIWFGKCTEYIAEFPPFCDTSVSSVMFGKGTETVVGNQPLIVTTQLKWVEKGNNQAETTEIRHNVRVGSRQIKYQKVQGKTKALLLSVSRGTYQCIKIKKSLRHC